MSAFPLPHDPEIEYPETDGQPMAESDIHQDVMVHAIQGLRDHFSADPQVYVAGNMLLYFEKGKRSSVAPDVFVVQGVPKHRRDKYLLWEERQAPCFVLEVTSKTTRDEDLTVKKSRYAELGVEEYFLFDPRGEYLRPRFQGLRLFGGVGAGGTYQPIPVSVDGSLASRRLGVVFVPDGERLRMRDLATGQPLPGFDEWKASAQVEKKRAALEAAARQAAEERAAQESAARKAAEERAAQEAAARQAAEERAEAAEARTRALAEELEKLRRAANP
jgi:Uma2 family endonuclease